MEVCSIWVLSSIIFYSLIPSSLSLSFNLTNFDSQSIKTTGDASITNQVIHITPEERYTAIGGTAGRAVYVRPLQLWDAGSRNLADFTTHFSFVIDSNGSTNFADGITFFLAPVDSEIPPNPGGGGLGLAGVNMDTNLSAYKYVAVEFDTHQNVEWDPPYPHVGINLNSMRSKVLKPWENNVSIGRENECWITYNSTSQNLEVLFTGFMADRFTNGSVNYSVDLRDLLPEKVTIGFSGTTGESFQKNNVKSWSFNSSLEVNVPGPNTEPTMRVPSTTWKRRRELVVGLSVGIPFLAILFGCGCWWWWRRRRNIGEDKQNKVDLVGSSSMDNEFEMGTGPKKFSYVELAGATNNFSEDTKLGQGGFGGVYKGFLKDMNTFVAVKRVSKDSRQGPKEYASEVKIISRLRHRNLVQLMGWCHEQSELLLVYEFMPNGSLYSHLFEGKTPLTWPVRLGIVQGLASALLYLHEEWEQVVLHRDIKSSNILLDSNFNAKLGDFGVARLVDHEKGSQTTVLAGTWGYMGPECVISHKVSKESDVYSFGIVALEIACGRKPVDQNAQEDQVILVEWVWNLYGTGQLLEAADPKLSVDHNKQEIERLMIVGLWCAHPDKNLRPTIRQAILVLKSEASLPDNLQSYHAYTV